MASYLLGIDLGTSSVRAGIFREDGERVSIASRSYPILTPAPDRSEQNPEHWWRAVCEAMKEAVETAGLKGSELTGIACDGQMHGGALLDSDGQPVCPAIIWPDSRSAGELDELSVLIGEDALKNTVLNRVFPGTFAATLFWMKKHDYATWKRIRHILMPKDYIRFRMTGLYNTDSSDASATLLFDQHKRDWSDDILHKLDIPIEFMPYVVNSDEQIGETDGIFEAAGIPDGIPVVVGGADQACAAFGNGVLDVGTVLVTIGTGGQICTPMTTPSTAPDLCLNTFCHLPESRWYLMGATLSAGLCLSWFRDSFCPEVSFDELGGEASETSTGDCPLFLPYLPGKRSPDLNPLAHGVFSGIRLHHKRGHFARSIMEGVVFDLKESFDVMKRMDVKLETLIASGGGARSPLWMQIMSDIFDKPILVSQRTEQACFGAALLAGIGTGVYRDYHEAAGLVPAPSERVTPIRDNVDYYGERFEDFKRLYRKQREV